MSESSIASSPSKLNYSIHKTRLKRKTKRLKTDQSAQIDSNQLQNPNCFHNFLEEFYKISEDEPTGTAKPSLEKPAILTNFKPFELAKSLTMADQIFVQQQINLHGANTFPATQGFVICTNLPNTDNIENDLKNDSFDITESELINCCHQIEKVMENVASEVQDYKPHELTPKKTSDMSIVNSILEDFSLSPLSNDQMVTNISWDYTPEFRLRRLPIKKYQKRKRTNLIQRFEEPDAGHSSENEDDLSCPSLSEDSFCENPNNQSGATSLNYTNRLCNNILNLTNYFTQNDMSVSFLDEVDDENDLGCLIESNDMVVQLCKTSDLLNEILKFRSVYSNDLLDNSYDSSDDFKGFSNSNNNTDTNSSTDQKNIYPQNLNLAPHVNGCDIEHYDTFKKGKEETNAFLAFWNEDDCQDVFAGIDTENILEQNNEKITTNEITNIEEDNFTDRAMNSDKTFIIPNVPDTKPTSSNFICFKTASSKPIKVSREAHLKAAKILNNLPEIADFNESASLQNCDNKTLNKDENIFGNPEDYEWNDDCDLFLNFKTPIISEERIEARTQQNLSTLLKSTKLDHDGPSTSKFLNLGYTRAAEKNISVTLKSPATCLNEFASEISNKDKFQVYAKTQKLKTGTSSLSDNDEELHKAKNQEILKITENNDNKEDLEITEDELEKPTNSSFSINNHNSLEKESHKCTKTEKSENDLFKEFEKESPSEHFLANLDIIENHNNIMKPNLFTTGFQTAHGQEISITQKAKEVAQQFFKEFKNDIDTCENDLLDLKTKVHIKNRTLKATLNNPMEINPLSQNINKGFQTANGKEIAISTKAKQTVENLLKEFNTVLDVETCEKDLKDLKTKILHKNKDLKQNFGQISNGKKLNENVLNTRSDQLNNENPTKQDLNIHNSNSNINIGFRTANGKQVFISENAKKSVENILKEFNTDLDVVTCEENLKDLKTKILNQNKNLKLKAINENFPTQNTKDNKSVQNDFKRNDSQINENSNINIEMQTSKDKQVCILEKETHFEENFLNEFSAYIKNETCKNDLKEIKTKIENINKCGLINSSPKQSDDNVIPKITIFKRKFSTDSSDLETPKKQQPEKIFKNDLRASKSALVEQSLKSPLLTVTRSIIPRRNLLTLTKKRRNKGSVIGTATDNISEIDNNLNETPEKSNICLTPKQPAPETPNLKEFLSNASLTSTPVNNKPPHLSSLKTLEDSDLKPIIWKNDSLNNKSANTSFNSTKVSNNSSANISFNSTNPTAKERIDRLKMYGKAPDVSPILIETNHNCRPSGLRRTRSMLKKKEK